MAVHRMSALRSYDAFAKPVEGIRNKSAVGGVITVIASVTATVLFVSQMCLYWQGETRHSFSLARSFPISFVVPTGSVDNNSNKKREGMSQQSLLDLYNFHKLSRIAIHLHITFPHISCRDLDYSHDNASESSGTFAKLYGRNSFIKRPPNEYEFAKATGQSTHRKTTHRQDPKSSQGCTVRGTINVPKVGGTLTVTVSARAWIESTNFGVLGMKMMESRDVATVHNVSHYIHHISFGETFPVTPHPLTDVMNVVANESGLALVNIMVKLVPTHYKRFARRVKDTYQASVTEHIIQPETLAAQQASMLPGISLSYDFTPLAVHHVESRENIFVFLSSLVSIVGGVFVTVGLVSGILVNSAAVVAKKKD